MDLEMDVSLASIETVPPKIIGEYDLIVFGFPVFELSMPQIVHDYLDHLPQIDSKGVFLFCTMGLAAGNAFRRVFSYFKIKGFHFLGSAKIKMPGTDGLVMLKENSTFVQKAIEKNYDEVKPADTLVHEIVTVVKEMERGNGVVQFRKSPPFNLLDFMFGWIIHLLYKIMVKYMKKRYWVDDTCNQCNFCVKICPIGNITLEKTGIKFHDQCIVCLRCVHQCPQHSIQIGNFTSGKFRWHGPKGDYHPPLLR